MLCVVLAVMYVNASNEGELALQLIEQQTMDTADSYFDGINTMMVTGTMNQSGLLRDKILARPGIIDARIIRGEGITRLYGEGKAENRVVDELDRRALAGENIIEISKSEQGRVLTVINPVKSSENYRGTNCMACHQSEAGTVLGAVRISYSLAEVDKQVSGHVVYSGLVYLGLFLIGGSIFYFVLRRLVTARLRLLSDSIQLIERQADLTIRLPVSNSDEICSLANVFNTMLGKFQHIIQEVSKGTQHLTASTDKIANDSAQSVTGLVQQQKETELAATAMTELTSTAQEVAKNTSQTAEATHHANDETSKGNQLASQALGGMEKLRAEVENAAKVIQVLVERSDDIGNMLDVIKGIAEQTNLLALNAAIEAARAGEQGRGFAVVADEVRTLAMRTHESTEEIEKMIVLLHDGVEDAVRVMESAQTQAEDGKTKVAMTTESLTNISQAIIRVNEMNTQIATAAEEQTAVVEEVNRNIVSINHVSEQTAEGAQQVSSASTKLCDLARSLSELVGQFKV